MMIFCSLLSGVRAYDFHILRYYSQILQSAPSYSLQRRSRAPVTTHCSLRWVGMVRTSSRGIRNHIGLHDRNESLYNRRDTHGFCLYNNAAFYPWQFRWYLPCLIWDLLRGLKRINYTLYSQGPNHLMVYNVFTVLSSRSVIRRVRQ